ncbi:hypothetical protein ACQEVC_12920 [Plantactinospora sp. CA-294935]|uniref:hypothetical protein n=1 Tax=Plantactinospora sp. CA-294935 TaxID=3240012 RepID=UPI003D936C89
MGFFDGKKPAAILKHAIMDQYVDPFVGKTGKYSPDRRVGIIDGYAGEGRYESGDEASPALLIRKARTLLNIDRRLESYFVASEPNSLARLQQVVNAEAAGLPVHVFSGSIEEHLDHPLTRPSQPGMPPDAPGPRPSIVDRAANTVSALAELTSVTVGGGVSLHLVSGVALPR